MTHALDLNADLGEGAGHDAVLMTLITSANIACGGHAGDDASMREAVALARSHGVAVGAHPGFADPAHFGRRELPLSPVEIRALVDGQVRRLQAFGRVRHVKLHGALYNLAARDDTVARAAADAVGAVDAALILFAPPGSALARAGAGRGLRVAHEVFADRTYQPDGSLTPRGRPDALIRDPDVAVAQVLRVIREGVVDAVDGTAVALTADTICLHGDGPDPVAFARQLRTRLTAAGVQWRIPFSEP